MESGKRERNITLVDRRGKIAYVVLRQSSKKVIVAATSPDVPNYVAHARMNDRTDAEGSPGTLRGDPERPAPAGEREGISRRGSNDSAGES